MQILPPLVLTRDDGGEAHGLGVLVHYRRPRAYVEQVLWKAACLPPAAEHARDVRAHYVSEQLPS